MGRFNSKDRKRTEPKGKGPDYFLKFGAHKVCVTESDTKTFAPDENNPVERYAITFKGRGPSIEGFSGHEGVDYQKITFKPFTSFIHELPDEIATVAQMDAEGKDMPTKDDDLYPAFRSYKAIDTLALICDQLGLTEEYDAIDEETIYGHITKACDLIANSNNYAWYCFTEKDSKNKNTGKIYPNVAIYWDSIYSLDEVQEVNASEDGSTYDILLTNGKNVTFEKNAKTYMKLQASPNDQADNASDPMGGQNAVPVGAEPIPF